MTLLSIDNLSKSFGGLMAVNEVTFDVEAGSIVGLIGPNGAGKTTVFNLITGNYQPNTGTVLFDGQNLVGLPTHTIVERGIARTFQTIRLFQNMSVLENVLAGGHCRMRSGAVAAMLRTPAQRREGISAPGHGRARICGSVSRMGQQGKESILRKPETA
jgi:branched-chain amino acid transport system ATP-binding protein